MGLKKSRRGTRRRTRRTMKRGGLWPFGSASNAANPGLKVGPVPKSNNTSVAANPGLTSVAPIQTGTNVSVAANPGLTIAPNPSISRNAPFNANKVYAPKPGQFGYTDPNQVRLSGSFTEYQMGVPGFGVRGYTQPGANPFAPGAMQHVGLTGYPQLMGVAGLAMSQPKVQGSFNINQMPPDYYTPLGLVNKRTPFTKAELNAAYNQKKNLGTNADKKLVKNAYNTLSDPEKRYKHDTAMTEYFTAHPPSISDLLKMAPQRPGGPSSANILKGLSYMPPAISSQLNNPINPSQIQAR